MDDFNKMLSIAAEIMGEMEDRPEELIQKEVQTGREVKHERKGKDMDGRLRN